jgi:autotransporter-associated beta strand protein
MDHHLSHNIHKPMKKLLLTLCLSVSLSLAASALTITVDPATPITGTYAVEWNGSSLESWSTTQITGASVSGGNLSGTTSGTDPQITRTIPSASRPDLDLGFNDFIELRMRVPASYADDIQIYYGTTVMTGFSGDRVISIPNATIPKDGALHTYRIDVGPEPWWRASLQNLRIDPGNVSGVAFAIDYLRVGDEPNPTVYQPRYTTKCPAVGGTTPTDAYQGPGWTVVSMESKHFRVISNTYMTTQLGWTDAKAKGTLRNLEEAWQVYVKILGYREPAYNVGTTSGTAYKLNVTNYYDGYWAGIDDFGGTSLAQLNITPGGLQVDPPTWVIPHELMHCFQFHNTSGKVNGEWFETHANYGRERWLNHYQNVYPNRSNVEALGVRDGHFMMSSGRNYYLTWPFMYYVDTNPDALPDLSEGMIKRVWQETQAEEFPMMALDRLTPTTSLKDIAGYYARRCATWDFSNQAAMTAELNNQDPNRNARHLFTDLLQRADDPAWWRVPLNKAPAQGAYAMHELIPAGSGAGRVVTVNLRGLADSARGADWRASLVAVSDTGVERYTPLWSTGSSSITLAANENKLYLSVAGTPDVFYYGGHDESSYRFRSHPSRSRFHYEVQVTGATPRERNNGATTGLTQHSNGGGYRSVSVPTSVYIGPNARVTGGSVSGNARIEDYAVVSGGTVNSSAVISGHAWVSGGTVTDNARVRDWGIVDNGTISGNARVLEHATVSANMQDTAVAKGSALHQSGGVLSGNAIVDGDYMFNKSLTGGVTFGHWPWVGVPDNFTTATPAGLYAAYNFRTAHDSRALDQYGVIDAFPIGSPAWTANDGERRGFLTFNGSNQSIALDRSVADSRAFTFSAWVKPTGGPANQAVLWLGASTTRRMALTASDANGKAKFSIVNGGTEQTLTASTALPVGTWSHIAVTLNGTTGVLYVNGTQAASGSITIRPDQLLAANTTTAAQHNYLARSEGSTMPMFQGSLDDVQFYSSTLTAAQITTLATPPTAVGDLMLSDSFTAGSYDSGSFNTTLATDQQGYIAPTSYTIAGGAGWQAQHGNGGTMLLVGDSGYHSRASLNQDFALLANEFEQPLAFQMDAWVDTGNDTCWASVVLGNSQNLNANSSGAKFAIRPLKTGSLEVWVNGSQMTSASRSGNTFRIVLSDTAGTGSAFNGNGSKAALYNGATLVGTYPLPQLSPGNGYLTFGAQPDNGYMLVRFDNLNISKITPPPTALTWQGDTSTDFNTASNYLENTWAEWTPYIFDSRVANGTMNVDAYTGWGNISLNSGLTTDIVIQSSNPSANPIIMAPGLYAGGTITIAAESRNLTLNTDYLAANAQVWNVGAGRTLASNGSFSGWNGAAASLEKQGSGTAILSGSSSYTGGTSITGGTLQVGTGGTSGTLGSGTVSIASGATLTINRSDAYGTGSGQVFGGAGTLVKEGTGALVFNGTSDHTSVASLQNLTINNGLVRTDYYGTLKSDLNLTVNGFGKFEMWSTSASLGTLNGNGTVQNTSYFDRATTLTVAAGSFSGGITDGGGNTSLSFVKSSSGTLTLSGSNSYTGPTAVNAGKLILSGSLTSDVTATTTGTLAPQGSPATTKALNITSTGRLEVRPGDTLTVASTVTLAGHLDIIAPPGLAPGTSYTILNKTSPESVSGSFTGKPEGSTFTASGYEWQITYTGGNGGNDTIITIPLPTALSALETWRQTHFGTTQNTGNAADSFDSNNDGESNLLEFATGQSPHTNSRAATIITFSTGANMEFTYTRSKEAFDAGYLYQVEHSDTLAPSSWVAAGSGTVITDGPSQTVRAIIPQGNNARRFVRLRVNAP